MIILKHLTVEGFRLLQKVDLHFPQRGSILIQGQNEAGKSALFESLYFALYGEPLASVRDSRQGQAQGRATTRVAPTAASARFVGQAQGLHPTIAPPLVSTVHLDDLIRYGETQAIVTLTLSVGATELTIRRSITRGKGQNVALHVRRLGMPEEPPLTDLAAANERIITELGYIDGETVRNSCLIEQKGLDRLERISGHEREAALGKMLGLGKFTRLAEQFTWTDEDQRLLEESTRCLKLAEIQARIPELSMQLGQREAALDAVAVRDDLAEISQQEAEIAEQQLALEHIQGRRVELKGRQNRVQQLKKAEHILDEIIAAYDAIAEAQRELPELERQLADLERRERDELPALEQRVRDLSDLARSFGTLERMAADLLNAINTIKELEQEIKQHEHLQESIADLDEQIIHARLLVEEATQAQHELEEHHRTTRPQLEARLGRLRALAERLAALSQAEETYSGRRKQRELAAENHAQISKVRHDLQETEQELKLVEQEAQQVQQRADTIEQRWRLLSIRRQLEGWLRLKSRSQGLIQAEQHVMAAHQHQEQLTMAALAAQRGATIHMGMVIACAVLAVLCAGGAVVEVLHHSYIFASIAGITALVLMAIGGVNLQSYSRTREKEREIDRQVQEAIGRVSMMVTAREAAARTGNNQEELAQVEHEIQALGGAIPRSIEEAQLLLQRIPGQDESLADLQQQMTESRNQALAARSQVNVTMEAVAALRKEKARLQEVRQQEGWDQLEEKLQADQETIEQLRRQVVTAAGEEGLPIPKFDSIGAQSSTPNDREQGEERGRPYDELATALENTIKSSELEIATMEGKMAVLPALVAKVKVHQDALDVLLSRKKAVVERDQQFQANNPMQQIEQAREQQIALRDALRSLQNSLRQRVQALGVSFGQASITTAEANARKHLEALHIALGRKVELETRQAAQSTRLKECQESLSEHYRQLAKLSSTLGSWIVPPNPFAEALQALRAQCEREVQEANESSILNELESLNNQEGASRAKIELCQHEIEEAQERIATMLAQHSRPPARTYTLADIAAVWPLVGEYSPQERGRLQEQLAAVEKELHELEEQELQLSATASDQASTVQEGGSTRGDIIDLEQARRRMQQQERNYQVKKHAGRLVAAATDRLMRKMLPRTEYYMQQLLPLLTRGRYHDVRLATEAEEGTSSGGPLQVQLWEPGAGEYIAKPALSSGAADQVSLALRLAFAIAALPGELSAAPGFLLLDEPLSAASRDRMRALVDLLTGDLLARHFEQIFFISQSTAFDPAMFPYRVYIDEGQVVESNLPMVDAYVQEAAGAPAEQNGYGGRQNNPVEEQSGVPHEKQGKISLEIASMTVE